MLSELGAILGDHRIFFGSRRQKVGIWAWDDSGWISFFSSLCGWATVILQLSGFYCKGLLGKCGQNYIREILIGYVVVSKKGGGSFKGSYRASGMPLVLILEYLEVQGSYKGSLYGIYYIAYFI